MFAKDIILSISVNPCFPEKYGVFLGDLKKPLEKFMMDCPKVDGPEISEAGVKETIDICQEIRSKMEEYLDETLNVKDP